MNIMTWVWLGVLVLFVLVELVDAGTLVSIWFSLGAIIPLCMTAYQTYATWYIILQIVVFGLVSTLSILFLRKFAKKALFKNNNETTNLDMYLGKEIKVVKVENGKAVAKLNGIEYTVIGEKEENFEVGEKVSIVKFSGNKIIVKKIENKE